ncbi:spore germination protein KB [Natronobacillus azotifigens]|uniref:Endospore germination permease n=1 Tax=Natronobacillus azotifigens TaxID=472978 RepID=A0A9J6R9V3_9BACI|nr:endospore germination permease [Natronobacillus azotifigens]MCZ0702068.1 endospore germination permease [Natronobacillus azotifigens]
MDQKISAYQFFILVFMNTLGTAILFIPTHATTYGKENGWITVVFATIFGLLVIAVYNAIFSKEETRSLFVIIDDNFGKWLGSISILFALLFAYFTTFANLWSIGQFVGLHILMGTPPEAIVLLVILTCLVGVRYGIEVIGRASEIFLPFTLISLILLVGLVWPEAQLDNIQPILQTNVAGAFVGIIPVIGITFLELFCLLGVIHRVNNIPQAKKAFFIGGLVAGFCMIIVTFACIAVIGVDGTIRHIYSIYFLGQNISIAEFFERVEGLVAFIWFITIFFKICTNFYFIAIAIKHLGGLKDFRTVTIPIAYFLFVSAVTSLPNIFYDFELMNSTYLVYAILTGFLLPILLLIVKIARKK